MSSSLQRKNTGPARIVSNLDSAAFPDQARPSDDSPTVISKAPPIVDGVSSSQHKITDLSTRSVARDAILADLKGRRLAHYELVEWIGEGGMAAVLRARDLQLDRFVALKILPPEMAQENENVLRFHQEAKAAAKLDHPNIARVFYCGEDHGLHFIAFEYVEGINLKTMLDQRGRISVAEAVRYVLQVATGLEHAASRGVVHRDVKPSNIIITPTGQAKLVDMGLARNMERRGENDLTQSGVTLGTFDYISPEQALEPRDADARSDIYSLGCTLYHLLTGLPPVPEGTPAKKLHHHQHLAPVDPREIDPSIPEELVMVLGKMMAKNPKERYQRPVQLVHHLMKIAQKVGAANDVAEGLLIVDAPLPTEPRSRPFLILGLALVALAVVTLLLSIGGDPRGYVPVTSGPTVPDHDNSQAKIDKGKEPDRKNIDQAAALPEVVRTRDELKQVLASPAKVIKARLEATTHIDLDGLVFKGAKDQRLELYSGDDENSIVRMQYQNAQTPIGLVVAGGAEVVFRRITFELESATTPIQAVAAVAVRGARVVRFEKCVFEQPKVPMLPSPPATPSPTPRVQLASVLIDAPKDGDFARPIVIFEDCCFDTPRDSGGQMAVAINGAANIKVSDTAFKPHGAFFHFREKCTRENTSLFVDHCAGLVVLGPAFRFNKGASAQVRVEHTAFSRPSGALAPNAGLPEPGLISLATGSSLKYEGADNLYHNLNAMVEWKNPPRLIAKADEFRDFLGKFEIGGSDLNPRYLDLAASPWQNPTGSAQLAFQLKPEYHAKVGLRTTWAGQAMPAPAGAMVAKTGPRELIVDPDYDDAVPKPFTYKTLASALGVAGDGDVVKIKCGDDEERVVEAHQIELRPRISVTLKPFSSDYRPLLKLDKAYRNKDAYLFKVTEGALKIEHLEFLLDPDAPEVNEEVTQSIAHLGELAHLRFSNCVLTLKAPDNVQLNVAKFIDLSAMFKMKSAGLGAPRIDFHECFARGKGDLVTLHGCRLLDVEVKNSLVALHGSLLEIHAANKEMAMSQGVSWRMSKSSIFTADAPFLLRANNGKILTETNADAEQCLFAGLIPGTPAVYLEMDRIRSEELGKYFQWKGRQNFIANYESAKVLDPDLRPEGNTLTFPRLEADKTLVQKLWDATPDWFRPMEGEMKAIEGMGIPTETEKNLLPGSVAPDE